MNYYRPAIIALALVSPFFFPSVITFILALLSGIAMPVVAIVVGVLVDLVSYVPEAGLPLGTLIGFALFGIGTFVRRFVHAYIL